MIRVFKVYNIEETHHVLAKAQSPHQAAGCAVDVWKETGLPLKKHPMRIIGGGRQYVEVKVVQMCLPDDDVQVGVIYEPSTTPEIIRIEV